MESTRHSLMDNKVQLYMRPESPHWQCACSISGKQRRTTTKEESLARAKDVARDWYLGLIGKYRAGELKEGRTFKEASARFIDEFEVITQGHRSETYVQGHKTRIRRHLDPFFGNLVLWEITAGKVQEYRIHRMKTGLSRIDQFKKAKAERDARNGTKQEAKKDDKKEEKPNPPSRSALHQEIVCLRQILNTANRLGWLDHLPNLKAPFQASSKIAHRGWFSLEEYQKLYKATRKRKNNPPRKRWKWACEQLHDLVLFMANTGLRPDEALRLQVRDVEIHEDEGMGKTILLIAVRGKRGVGYCKSTPNAVRPFTRLRDRKRPAPTEEDAKNMAPPKPTDLIFPNSHHELFNIILGEEGLKFDREEQRRTLYSLRHTYICFRLMEGADIYQIAKNCRTSVEMIEKYYASHIQNSLDASAINVLRSGKVQAEEDDDDDENQKAGKEPKVKAKPRAKSPKRFVKKQF